MTVPKLSFGYLYDFRNPPEIARDPYALYSEIVDLAAWSETVGFEGAWVPEHHLAEDGYMPAPNVALAAIAARTKTIRLGSGIALAPLYHPLRFAEECAVLDILSGGRVEMALAIGYRRREYAAFGAEFGKRGSRFDEFLHIVRALWAGETVDFAGKHYQVQGAKLSPRSPRGQIPLYIGGFAEKALERVARYADGYFGNEDVCDLYFEKVKAQGKDPADVTIRIQGTFFTVARDPEAAMEELAPYYLHANNAYGAWLGEDQASGVDNVALKPMDLETFKRKRILEILTPEAAVAKFKAMQARMPVDHFMMMMPPGIPAQRFADYAQLFADEVIPAFA